MPHAPRSQCESVVRLLAFDHSRILSLTDVPSICSVLELNIAETLFAIEVLVVAATVCQPTQKILICDVFKMDREEPSNQPSAPSSPQAAALKRPRRSRFPRAAAYPAASPPGPDALAGLASAYPSAAMTAENTCSTHLASTRGVDTPAAEAGAGANGAVDGAVALAGAGGAADCAMGAASAPAAEAACCAQGTPGTDREGKKRGMREKGGPRETGQGLGLQSPAVSKKKITIKRRNGKAKETNEGDLAAVRTVEGSGGGVGAGPGSGAGEHHPCADSMSMGGLVAAGRPAASGLHGGGLPLGYVCHGQFVHGQGVTGRQSVPSSWSRYWVGEYGPPGGALGTPLYSNMAHASCGFDFGAHAGAALDGQTSHDYMSSTAHVDPVAATHIGGPPGYYTTHVHSPETGAGHRGSMESHDICGSYAGGGAYFRTV